VRFQPDVSARKPIPRNHPYRTIGHGHLLLGGLDGSLGDLAGFVDLDDTLDDTNSNSLSHVTDSKTSERWVVGESLDAHWLGGNHLDDSGITRLDELGGRFGGFTGTAIDLLQELSKLAGNVGSVAIQNRSITSTDLAGVVKDDDLGVERLGTLWRVVLGVTSDVTTANFLDGNVLDVESDVVTWKTLNELLVVHLDGLDFSGNTSWGEGNDHAGLDDTGLDTADWYCANTTDLVNILEGKTERLVGWAGWRVDGINGLEESLSGDLGLGLLLPALVPGAVGGVVDHVVTVEARDWDEGNVLWVVPDLLDEGGSLLDDFVETLLGPLGGVHLVDGDDELLDTQGVGKQGVLTSLAILGDTGLELTSTGSNDENSAISLGGTCDHVLDEITMTRGVCIAVRMTVSGEGGQGTYQ
jgi:hypothetical protein